MESLHSKLFLKFSKWLKIYCSLLIVGNTVRICKSNTNNTSLVMGKVNLNTANMSLSNSLWASNSWLKRYVVYTIALEDVVCHIESLKLSTKSVIPKICWTIHLMHFEDSSCELFVWSSEQCITVSGIPDTKTTGFNIPNIRSCLVQWGDRTNDFLVGK